MAARQRLNSLDLIGVLVIAGIIGQATESWAVFLVAAAVLTAILMHSGNIRPSPPVPSRRRRR